MVLTDSKHQFLIFFPGASPPDPSVLFQFRSAPGVNESITEYAHQFHMVLKYGFVNLKYFLFLFSFAHPTSIGCTRKS